MSTDGKKDPGKDKVIPMPDIYSEEFSVEETIANDAELENVIGDTESGFNPYDTAILYRK